MTRENAASKATSYLTDDRLFDRAPDFEGRAALGAGGSVRQPRPEGRSTKLTILPDESVMRGMSIAYPASATRTRFAHPVGPRLRKDVRPSAARADETQRDPA